MATTITEECINCGACEPECPNGAIGQGDGHLRHRPEALHRVRGLPRRGGVRGGVPGRLLHPRPEQRRDRGAALRPAERHPPGEELPPARRAPRMRCRASARLPIHEAPAVPRMPRAPCWRPGHSAVHGDAHRRAARRAHAEAEGVEPPSRSPACTSRPSTSAAWTRASASSTPGTSRPPATPPMPGRGSPGGSVSASSRPDRA